MTDSRARSRLVPLLVSAMIAGSAEVVLAQQTALVDLSRRFQFDIPAQLLTTALMQFSSQSGLDLSVSTDLVEGKQAPAVQGLYATDEALRALLAGSGLEFATLQGGVVAIRRNREPGDGPAPNSTDNESPVLDEILVTATKRTERIQDVPLSIAALSAQDIDRRSLVSAEDYLRGIPGVNQSSDRFGHSIVIRGIETSPNAQNFDSGTTVATYFGETPTTNSAGLGGGTNVDLKLVDIERVEVLRGPQGTAFGNSSLGGAVRTIPVAPRLDRVEGKVGAGYSLTSGSGSTNNMIQAVINVPLVDGRFAVRAVGYRFEDSGFYRNVAGSDAALQSTAAGFGAQGFAHDHDNVGATQFTGGRIAARLAVTDALQMTFSYLTQKTESDGQPYSTSNDYRQSVLDVAPEHVKRGQSGGLFDTDIDIASATVEYDLGWANLLGTYSHVESGSVYSAPLFPDLVWPWSELGPSDHRENTGEVRLTTKLAGPLNFIAGIYAETLKDRVLFNSLWYGSTATNPYGFTNPLFYDYLDRRELEQQAVFAEGTWKLPGHFSLTGGIRRYDYSRTASLDQTGAFGDVSTSRDADASGNSFRANLSYAPTEDALFYAGWSQGFRLGRPQPGLSAATCDLNNDGIVDGTNFTLGQTTRTESDEVDNYEIGTKLTLLDRRAMITADVFRIDWTGVPIRVIPPTPPDGCGFSFVTNAGEARSEGIEVQASFQIAEPLRVDIGGSHVRARLTQDAPALNARSGDRLPGSPKVNANVGVQYEFTLIGRAAFVRADSIYVGRFFSSLATPDVSEAGDYWKVDLASRITLDKLDVDLFLHNLTNTDVISSRGVYGNGVFRYRPRPRTLGLQLSYRF